METIEFKKSKHEKLLKEYVKNEKVEDSNIYSLLNKYDIPKLNHLRKIISLLKDGKSPEDLVNKFSYSLAVLMFVDKNLSKSIKSHYDKKIESFLKDNNIFFDEKKRFEECRDKNPLEFDYFLPDFNLLIEYDGIQHFQGKGKSLKDRQNKDLIKNFYCKRFDTPALLRISYKDESKINEILSFYLRHGDNLFDKMNRRLIDINNYVNDKSIELAQKTIHLKKVGQFTLEHEELNKIQYEIDLAIIDAIILKETINDFYKKKPSQELYGYLK
ncbi:MAG: hypothetical protein GF317_11120 [Candidatus Lokiarchaeota archaeon]|nr:hypothetical protein [Candidatus Lokiarchaeota archaeon]